MQTKNLLPKLDTKEYHTQKLHETIAKFLDFDPIKLIEHQNDLLYSFLEHESPDNVADVVFYTTFQTQFMTELKNNWDDFVKFNNVEA